ncbi:unnamed protein product [Symbiodinium natans]|uniref:Uncharacterized protein n=1 Tax=Symbiodinium natans TaxID=878477 RepID=A0A812MBK1_9DINO|nr:unnamed protein product [Symbiodinium natans]
MDRRYAHVCLCLQRQLLPDSSPLEDLHDHFRNVDFRPAQLFVKLGPLRLVQYFWDMILFEGEASVVTLCLLVLRACEPFLRFLDQSDIPTFFEMIRESDKLAWRSDTLEIFWISLIRAQVLKDFDALQRQVLELLAKDEDREFTFLIVDMEAAFPARPPPPRRLAEMVDFLAPTSQAPNSPSLIPKRITDPFVALSADTRDSFREGVFGAMQRLHNILDKPNAARSRHRLRDP